jgi:histidinol-phosphate aminotransferase
MQRRKFVRGGLASAFLAPAALTLPGLARASTPVADALGLLLRADAARLSQNENPLGMPAEARQAIIDAIVEGHRYPRLNGTVAQRIAGVNGVESASVVLGNGSAEILQMVMQAATAGGGARVILPDPTYEVARYAASMHAEVVRVPLRPDHTHDLERMKEAAAAASGPALVFICNPNNPTGTVTAADEVADWILGAPEKAWFLVDEAYFEFADHPAYRTLVSEAAARPNVVVSRTFSKIYGMAGVRLGYGIAHPDTVRRISAFAASNNINHLAASAGLACIDRPEFVRRSLQVNRQGLDMACAVLDELGIEHIPSQANFVMHRIAGDHAAYATAMRDEGIITGRAFPPMLQHNRVSIGLPEEMERWAAALRIMRRRGLA